MAAPVRQVLIRPPRFSPVALIVTVLCVVVFILQLLPGLREVLPVYFGLSAEGINHGFVWQFITYAFLHATPMHILFNLIAVFFFAPRLEFRMSSRVFALFYVVAAVVGGLFFYAIAIAGGGERLVVGASGAVYGILALWALWWPDEIVLFWGIFPMKMKWLILILLGVGVLSSADGGVAFEAHLGGCVAGVGWWWFTRGGRGSRRPRPRRRGPKLRLIMKDNEADRFRSIADDL